jgi:hypothetical protein
MMWLFNRCQAKCDNLGWPCDVILVNMAYKYPYLETQSKGVMT